MAAGTGVEWAHDSINPWWGCEKISPACENCYAKSMARRFDPKAAPWDGTISKQPAHKIQKHLEALENARSQRRVFVGSMTDLALVAQEDPAGLAAFLSDLYRLQAARAAHRLRRGPHIFILLTKRPAKLRSFLERLTWDEETMTLRPRTRAEQPGWPEGRIFPGLFMGVTAESQDQADKRIPELLKMPMAERFVVSAEPLLGPLDLQRWFYGAGPKIGWVFVGGETGGKGVRTRPMHPEWPEAIIQHGREAGVPIFFKAWGDWVPIRHQNEAKGNPVGAWLGREPHHWLATTVGEPPAGFPLMAKIPATKHPADLPAMPTETPAFTDLEDPHGRSRP